MSVQHDPRPAAAGSGPPPEGVVLEVRDLHTSVIPRRGAEPLEIIRGAGFRLSGGQRLALVGESASGKSMTALSIMQLLGPGSQLEGEVWLNGRDLLTLPPQELRGVRGNEIAMIFQDPMTSLNPVMTVGDQLVEAIRLHRRMKRPAAEAEAVRLLSDVQIPNAQRRTGAYPHEFSGGMRQRVMIAMALSGDPSVLLADEPTTALDVTVQAQVMDLLDGLAEEHGAAVVLITHDLGLVAGFADSVAVMYAGRVVELGSAADIFELPAHPYTEGLLQALCRLDGPLQSRLPSVPGSPPQPGALPTGCSFHPRCPYAEDICIHDAPPAVQALRRWPGTSECHFTQELLASPTSNYEGAQ